MTETVNAETATSASETGKTGDKPKSTRGGYRPGGGRPPGSGVKKHEKAPISGSALPALPPTQGGVTKAHRFFEFWAALTETQLAQTIVYVNRLFPITNAKLRDEKAPKYILKLVGPCPCPPADYKPWFYDQFGSGDYQVYFNEGNDNRMRVEITGLRDYTNYPPKIDWDTLMVNDPGNKDFVRWARTNGFADEIRRLEGEASPQAREKKEDEEMNTALIEQNTNLIGQVVTMAERVAEAKQAPPTPAPAPAAPRTSLEESKGMGLLEAAATSAIKMSETAFQTNIARTTSATDPLAQVTAIVELTRTLTTPQARSGEDPMFMFLSEALKESREELREMRNRMNSNQTPPQSLTDKLLEIQQLKALFNDGGDKEEKDEPARPGSPKAMLMEMFARNGPQLVTAILGGLGQLAYVAKLALSGPGGGPGTVPLPPGAVPPAQGPPQMNQSAPPLPGAPPNAAPPAMDDTMYFLRMAEGSIRKHMNEWGNRAFPGADFADWLIDSSLNGRMQYDQLRNLGGDALMNTLQGYPPIAEIMAAVPDKFSMFVQQFIGRDEIRKKEEDEDMEEGETE